MAGCAAVTATSTFAQDVCTNVEANQALYKKYTDNYDKNVEQIKVAVEAAKEYIGKYEACVDATTNKATYADQVNYLKSALPEREAFVKKSQEGAAQQAVIERFNTSAKAKRVPEIFASGKELVAKQPELIDVNITLAAAGFEQTLATPPVNTYNDEVIAQAKTVIQQLEAGKTSKGYGAFSYSFVNPKFSDTKSNTLGAMNYIIGYIMYYRQDKKKDALPYLYKSTQYNSFSKTDPTIYQAIGAWYLDEAIKIDKERQAKLVANGNKDNDETLAMVGNQKGYADRSIDAYARAYKIAKEDKAQKKEYVDGLYTRLKELYAFRYDNKIDGIDAFVATVQSKPMPDPTMPVTPVREDTPTPTAATTPIAPNTTTPTTKPATNTTVPNTPKPATSPTRKPVSTTTTKSASSTNVSQTTTKSNAKKPAPKKKGTR